MGALGRSANGGYRGSVYLASGGASRKQMCVVEVTALAHGRALAGLPPESTRGEDRFGPSFAGFSCRRSWVAAEGAAVAQLTADCVGAGDYASFPWRSASSEATDANRTEFITREV